MSNNKPQNNAETHQIKVMSWERSTENDIKEFPLIFKNNYISLDQNLLKPEGWKLESPQVLALLDKLKNSGIPLGEYVENRFYYGIKTGFNEAFVVDKETRDNLINEHPSSAEILKPLIRGRDVKRWSVNYQDLYLIFTRKGIDIEKYPAIKNHLMQYKDRLTPGIQGGRVGGGYKWFEIQANIAYYKYLESSKIIYPDIFEKSSFTVDNENFYLVNTLYFISTDEIWLCGLLNSSIVNWFYSYISNKIRGGYLRAFTTYMKRIPIPKVTEKEKKAIEKLVQKCIDAKGIGVEKWEKEIDKRVAKLYNLTPEEMKIIGIS